MKPCYIDVSEEKFNERIDTLFDKLRSCTLCPRNCKANRAKGEKGYCKTGILPIIFSYGPHFGEESVLTGFNGSGTIFFTSCNLSCVFCQNYEISQLKIGEEITYEMLADKMIRLQTSGCHNINLVSPTHQVPQIVCAVKIAREKGLSIPIVYNTNAYDSVETLRLLDGIIDIYMPDAKYGENAIAEKFSDAPNYFDIMKEAIREMQRQVGDLILDENGIALKGLIVRHLVLPYNLASSKKVFEFLKNEISENVFLNIMDQYHPYHKAVTIKELSRRITPDEFKEVVLYARQTGLKRIYRE